MIGIGLTCDAEWISSPPKFNYQNNAAIDQKSQLEAKVVPVDKGSLRRRWGDIIGRMVQIEPKVLERGEIYLRKLAHGAKRNYVPPNLGTNKQIMTEFLQISLVG